jgi:hypothetical protein
VFYTQTQSDKILAWVRCIFSEAMIFGSLIGNSIALCKIIGCCNLFILNETSPTGKEKIQCDLENTQRDLHKIFNNVFGCGSRLRQEDHEYGVFFN